MRPLLAVLLLVPAAAAQSVDIYEFTLEHASPQEIYEVPLAGGAGQLSVVLRLEDTSRDGTDFVVDGTGGGVLGPHRITLTAHVMSDHSRGWQATVSPSSLSSNAGDVHEVQLRAKRAANAENPFFQVRVDATLKPNLQPDAQEHRSIIVNFFAGEGGFSARSGGFLQLAPGDTDEVALVMTNGATLSRTFGYSVLNNPCNLFVVPPSGTTLGPRAAEVPVRFSIGAPEDKFWYWGESCGLTIGIFAVDRPEYILQIPFNVKVDGFYFDPGWAFTTAYVAIAVGLVLAVVRWRRERTQEELHGKPQKPWTIPVEEVYLKRLRNKDPRAWYVVRHHLMEEEYRSALMFHRALRRASSGEDSKERLVVRQELAYENWQNAWEKKIAKPAKKANKYEAKLQRKLDRLARRKLRKATRRHKKLVGKMRKAHEKRTSRLLEKWEKAVNKAEKKGTMAPARPNDEPPAYPAAPVLQVVDLVDHKWYRKAQRKRRWATKKEGNLEVRFEKADNKHLAKVRRKVARVAKKIEDPEFIRDHPLLRGLAE